MFKSALSAFAIVGLFALSACSDDGGDGDGSSSAALASDGACQSLCQKEQECLPPALFKLTYGTMNTCLSLCNGYLATEASEEGDTVNDCGLYGCDHSLSCDDWDQCMDTCIGDDY